LTTNDTQSLGAKAPNATPSTRPRRIMSMPFTTGANSSHGATESGTKAKARNTNWSTCSRALICL
jgi:hypothetical protein